VREWYRWSIPLQLNKVIGAFCTLLGIANGEGKLYTTISL
jgi:hypothetical protein